MKPPVAGCANDLDSSELEELEFAPERPAAKLPEAKFPGQPLGQLVEATGAQRLQEHERLPLPHSSVARLQFSDLPCTHAANTVGQFDEKRPRQTTSLKVVSAGSRP
jgi:hypothetical protein